MGATKGHDMEQLNRIHRRQLARFLDHLKRTGTLTPELESDVKRAYGFVFQDVKQAVQGHDKETEHEKPIL